MVDDIGLVHLVRIETTHVLLAMLQDPAGGMWTLCLQRRWGLLRDRKALPTCMICATSWGAHDAWHPKVDW